MDTDGFGRGLEDLARIAALEQALRDASGQRDAAQRRAARQGDIAQTWQQRAVDEVFLEDSVPAWQGYQPDKAEV